MTFTQKARSVSRNLEQLIDELPFFLLRLVEITGALDDRVEWRDFKFFFKVSTSKVVSITYSMFHFSDLHLYIFFCYFPIDFKFWP